MTTVFFCFEDFLFYFEVMVTGMLDNMKKDIKSFKILQITWNHKPLRKQTLGKILYGQTVCPVYPQSRNTFKTDSKNTHNV